MSETNKLVEKTLKLSDKMVNHYYDREELEAAAVTENQLWQTGQCEECLNINGKCYNCLQKDLNEAIEILKWYAGINFGETNVRAAEFLCKKGLM